MLYTRPGLWFFFLRFLTCSSASNAREWIKKIYGTFLYVYVNYSLNKKYLKIYILKLLLNFLDIWATPRHTKLSSCVIWQIFVLFLLLLKIKDCFEFLLVLNYTKRVLNYHRKSQKILNYQRNLWCYSKNKFVFYSWKQESKNCSIFCFFNKKFSSKKTSFT